MFNVLSMKKKLLIQAFLKYLKKHFIWLCLYMLDAELPSKTHLPAHLLWHSPAVHQGAKVGPAGVGIIWDPPGSPAPLFTPRLSCHPLCPVGWRGAEEQDNYDITAGWLSSSPSWWETEGRNGATGERLVPQESNPAHRETMFSLDQGGVCDAGSLLWEFRGVMICFPFANIKSSCEVWYKASRWNITWWQAPKKMTATGRTQIPSSTDSMTLVVFFL